MKFLQSLDAETTMTATRTPATSSQDRSSTASEESFVRSESTGLDPSSPFSEYEHISHPSTTSASSSMYKQKARLLYCKSHVSIHPTQFNKDNISGYLAIVEADNSDGDHTAVRTDEEGNVKRVGGREVIVTWVPDELLARMDDEDREGFKRVEGRMNGKKTPVELEEDGFVFVSLPPPKGEKYAFAIPLNNIYSILVYPPSLQHWYGSATFNLTGGISLPTLFFHDDESPLLAPSSSRDTQQARPRSQWGFPPFLSLLSSRCSLLRSRLLSGRANHNAELWLVNPSKADRDVHEAEVDDGHNIRSTNTPSTAKSYPPERGFPDANVLNTQPTPTQTLLTGLSSITSFSRKMGQQILSHPLAQEVVPHLPPAVRSLVNAPGEWERSGRSQPNAGRRGSRPDVASEFESARLYLARWARVVAEEGERARRTEASNRVGTAGTEDKSDLDDLTSSLGVFSLLSSPNSKRPIPHPTRKPQQPISSRDWDSFAAQGRDELYVRREIFQRGFSESTEPAEKQCRREGWEVLLGIIPWTLGGSGGGESGKAKRKAAREEARQVKRREYTKLKGVWRDDGALKTSDSWKEEWHRIDVDCRRTDRTQPIFAIPPEAAKKGDGEKEAGGPGYSWDGAEEEEEGGSARLNPHIAALRMILMTYHTYLPELGYVQGMSDLLSPIYVVFDGNEADSFWGLVGVMQIMESNFLRDQSGMKRKLSTLQQLIGVMDPELYSHLERTGSLNLFFCFRWILINFKREFKFNDVIKLWEVLWTNYYSDQFVLFVALAVLQSHRDVLIRYLTEFDEVLKYANDLSGTIDLDTTLAQAEVLFLQFKGLIEDSEASSTAGPSDEAQLRKRRGSAGPKGPKDEMEVVEAKKKDVLDGLKELLNGFKVTGV